MLTRPLFIGHPIKETLFCRQDHREEHMNYILSCYHSIESVMHYGDTEIALAATSM
jgi:hypothetical protein